MTSAMGQRQTSAISGSKAHVRCMAGISPSEWKERERPEISQGIEACNLGIEILLERCCNHKER